MNSTIGIIGANSYIARNLIRYMQHEHKDFLLFDRQETHMDSAENYTQVDPFDKRILASIANSCASIYYFIGKTGTYQGFTNFDTFIDVNQRALLNLLDVCRTEHKNPKIIFPSTRLVYKGSSNQISEQGEKEFKSIYAVNKYACELYLELYHKQFGINYCIFRICVPFGSIVHPVSSYGTVDFFLKQAMGGTNITLFGEGHQKRTFTYIEDLCKVLLHAGLNEKCVNDVYNVGGNDSSILQVAEQIATKYNVSVEKVPWPTDAQVMESGDTIFDNQKLNRIFPYQYTTTSTWLNEME